MDGVQDRMLGFSREKNIERGGLKKYTSLTIPQFSIPHHPSPSLTIPYHPSVLKFLSLNWPFLTTPAGIFNANKTSKNIKLGIQNDKVCDGIYPMVIWHSNFIGALLIHVLHTYKFQNGCHGFYFLVSL